MTLAGPGGIGKTRLALQIVSELGPEFPDGAAFISLASLEDPELVAATAAHALGVREEGPEGPLEVLRDHLSERTMLLALDNFEHVMRAAGVVTGLIDGCPGVRLVVTSREALRVQAEYEFPVTSMDAADAVELFTRRAAAVRHGFVLDERNASTLERIVAALEGVPLAIELAAAQVRVLPPDAILERLDRRLEFLTDGAKDLPERQRALRTTMDWSYDLLDDDDKGLFATLGVFAGSFSFAWPRPCATPTVTSTSSPASPHSWTRASSWPRPQTGKHAFVCCSWSASTRANTSKPLNSRPREGGTPSTTGP